MKAQGSIPCMGEGVSIPQCTLGAKHSPHWGRATLHELWALSVLSAEDLWSDAAGMLATLVHIGNLSTGRWRREDWEFEASLGYRARPCLITKAKTKRYNPNKLKMQSNPQCGKILFVKLQPALRAMTSCRATWECQYAQASLILAFNKYFGFAWLGGTHL